MCSVVKRGVPSKDHWFSGSQKDTLFEAVDEAMQKLKDVGAGNYAQKLLENVRDWPS